VLRLSQLKSIFKTWSYQYKLKIWSGNASLAIQFLDRR
jgi:hypothetical protein